MFWILTLALIGTAMAVHQDICDRTFDVLAGETRTIDYLFRDSYPGQYNCVFHLKVTGADRLRISFSEFDVEKHAQCNFDSLQVFDGPDIAGHQLAKLCGDDLPQPIETQGNIATLRFVSDERVEKSGFLLHFSKRFLVSGLCLPTFTKTSGGFRSPYYPRNYPNNVNCTYKIAPLSGNQILIQFSRFQLHESSNCRWDYVTITSRSGQQIGPKLCGNLNRTSYLVSGSHVIIKFVSSTINTDLGFELTYKVVENCGTQVFQPTFETQSFNIVDGRVVETRKRRSRRTGGRREKILGGDIARHGSWPWSVSLQHRYRHFCGGTLIRTTWVITAAHCFDAGYDKTPDLVVKAGHSRGTEAQMQKRDALRYMIHGEYTEVGIKNDICLVQVKLPFQITDYVRIACMPQPDYEVPGDSICIVSGWGKTYDPTYQNDLKQAVLPIHSYEDCLRYMGGDMLDKTQMCGGWKGAGHDTCQGDSGGPLVCLNNNKWTVQGLTSWGSGCEDKKGNYGSYTRVSKYLDWIYNKLDS